jgi:hypothetical protein
MVSIPYQFVQIALMHLTILLVEARAVSFTKRHHYHKVEQETTNEDLEHCYDYKDVCQRHHDVCFRKDFDSALTS